MKDWVVIRRHGNAWSVGTFGRIYCDDAGFVRALLVAAGIMWQMWLRREK